MGGAVFALDAEGTIRIRLLNIRQRLTSQEYPHGTREEFMRNCKDGKYDDVVAIYRSNASTKVRFCSLLVVACMCTDVV